MKAISFIYDRYSYYNLYKHTFIYLIKKDQLL